VKQALHTKTNTWLGHFAEWIEGEDAYLSVVFSWELQKAHMRAVALNASGYRVHAGGPAVAYQPHYLAGVAGLTGYPQALPYHNPNATFTSRGCIRKCEFCIVPKIEGDIRELPEWEPKPIVCDNNLLACSRAHFDRVIDSLKGVNGVDFNQGLDARLLTEHHASRLAELDLAFVRLAWDNVSDESLVMDAIARLRRARIPRDYLRVYCLIGYKDTPADAAYRLQSLRNLHILTNPMRYQPLDAKRRNVYVAPGWTDWELVRFVRYWSDTRNNGSIPFEKFR